VSCEGVSLISGAASLMAVYSILIFAYASLMSDGVSLMAAHPILIFADASLMSDGVSLITAHPILIFADASLMSDGASLMKSVRRKEGVQKVIYQKIYVISLPPAGGREILTH
jgi:hypothetical protein